MVCPGKGLTSKCWDAVTTKLVETKKIASHQSSNCGYAQDKNTAERWKSPQKNLLTTPRW